MFGEWAEKFHDLGYNVLPCSGKIPQKPFASWLESPQPPQLVDAWVECHSESNIALIMGNNSVAIDVDTLSKEDTERARKICEAVLPKSPMEKTGKKGFTLFFRGQVATYKSKSLALDILGIGSYTVIPPSVHPETEKPYTWSKDVHLTHVKELPEITEETIKRLVNEFQLASIFKKVDSTRQPTDAQVEVGLIPGNRNNYFSKFVWDLLRDSKLNNMSDKAIMNALLKEDELNLKPMGAEYFSDVIEWKSDDRQANVRKFFERAKVKAHKKDVILPAVYEMVEHAQAELEEEKISTKGYDKLAKIAHEEFITSQRRALLDLIPRGGLIEEIYTYIHRLYPTPSPTLPFTGALGILSTLGCNTYETHDVWPNLYVLAVAFSGAGKSFPQRAAKRILNAMGRGANRLIGSGSYGSPEGILADIPFRPKRTRLDIYDEFGSFMHKISSEDRFKVAKHTLMHAWSESSGSVLGRAKAYETVLPICNPCVNLVAYTTPSDFKQYIDSKFVSDGFGARMLYFIDDRLRSDEKGKRSEGKPEVPLAVIEGLREFFLEKLQEEQISDDVGATRLIFDGGVKKDSEAIERMVRCANFEVKPHNIELSREAGEAIDEIDRVAWKRVSDLNWDLGVGEEHYMAPVIQRKVEMIYKLTLIYAMSQKELGAISEAAVLWAEKIFNYSLKNLEYHLGHLLVSREPMELLALIAQWIKDYPGTLIRKADLRKFCAPHIGASTMQKTNGEFEAICHSLMEAGVIKIDESVRASRHLVFRKL